MIRQLKLCSNLNISPRGPKGTTLDDILVLKDDHKSSDSRNEFEDENTETDIEDQQTQEDSPDELLIQVFTKIKNTKKKVMKKEAHTMATRAQSKTLIGYLLLSYKSIIKSLIWNLRGIVNSPS